MGVTLNIVNTIKDTEDFKLKFSRNLGLKIAEWGEEVKFTAKQYAPYDTGDLEKSIEVEVSPLDEYRTLFRIYSDLPYARIQEFGGIIRPKKAQFLAWVTSGVRPTTKEGWNQASKEGRAVFAKEVYIPSQPYMSRALKLKEARLSEKLLEAWIMSGQ